MKKMLVAVVVCATLWVTAFGTVAAQDSPVQEDAVSNQALSVNPAIVEEVVAPGDTTVKTITLTNLSPVSIPIKASVGQFLPNEPVEDPAYEENFRASNWFTVTEPDFILQPNQSRPVTVTITVPPGAEPGGHYATVYFQSLIPEEAVTTDKLYLAGRVGTLAFLTVKGDVQERLEIARFGVPFLQQPGPLQFPFAIQNDGNVHLLPTGMLRVYNWRGKLIQELPMSAGMVLPHTTREFSFQWNDARPFGMYSVQAELTYGDQNQRLETKVVRFIVVPWLQAAVIGLVIVPFLWLALRTKRRWRKAWRAYSGHERRPRR